MTFTVELNINNNEYRYIWQRRPCHFVQSTNILCERYALRFIFICVNRFGADSERSTDGRRQTWSCNEFLCFACLAIKIIVRLLLLPLPGCSVFIGIIIFSVNRIGSTNKTEMRHIQSMNNGRAGNSFDFFYFFSHHITSYHIILYFRPLFFFPPFFWFFPSSFSSTMNARTSLRNEWWVGLVWLYSEWPCIHVLIHSVILNSRLPLIGDGSSEQQSFILLRSVVDIVIVGWHPHQHPKSSSSSSRVVESWISQITLNNSE